MVKMQAQMKERGVTVLAVSIDVDPEAYQHFLEEHHVNLLTVRDPDQKSSALFGSFRWPETYIIDRQGIVRRKMLPNV